jgi:HD superfamily phosphohydrolase YqeK
MAAYEKQHLGRARSVLTATTALVAAAVLALLIDRDLSLGPHAPIASVLVFVVFLVWATNFQVLLSQDLFVSPDLMVVMAAVAAFHGHDGLLSAALVGFSGGLVWISITNPARTLAGNLLVTAFNCGQFLLAATSAALAYEFVVAAGEPRVLAGAALAAVAYAAVNMVLMLAYLAAGGTRVREAWTDMAPALPGFFAFGVVGALVGQLYSVLGLTSLVVLVVPSLVARRTFRSTLVLREARGETIAVFLKALEVKDLYTARHTQRVAKYSCYIGEELGFRPNRLTDLRHAAMMHDIGKLAVSSKLLNKPGKLTEAEYQDVRRHNEVCVEILSQVEFLRSTIPVATDRHGTFNAGVGKADVPTLHGYIVSVADAFDAMTSTRAYRKALSQDVAFGELRKGKGTQFHPASVDALIAGIERRGERFGAGYEVDLVDFEFEPPAAGVGSAGLGDLEGGRPPVPADPFADLPWLRRGRG